MFHGAFSSQTPQVTTQHAGQWANEWTASTTPSFSFVREKSLHQTTEKSLHQTWEIEDVDFHLFPLTQHSESEVIDFRFRRKLFYHFKALRNWRCWLPLLEASLNKLKDAFRTWEAKLASLFFLFWHKYAGFWLKIQHIRTWPGSSIRIILIQSLLTNIFTTLEKSHWTNIDDFCPLKCGLQRECQVQTDNLMGTIASFCCSESSCNFHTLDFLFQLGQWVRWLYSSHLIRRFYSIFIHLHRAGVGGKKS